MKSFICRYFTSFVILFFTICSNAFAQDNSTSLSIKKVGKGQTTISWTCPFKDATQISLQRSLDSSKYFTTVYSPSNVNIKNFSYTDFYPKSNSQVFYRVSFVTKSGEVFFSKPVVSRDYEGKYSLALSSEKVIMPLVKNNSKVQVNNDNISTEKTKELVSEERRTSVNNTFSPQKSHLPNSTPIEQKKVKKADSENNSTVEKTVIKGKKEIEKNAIPKEVAKEKVSVKKEVSSAKKTEISIPKKQVEEDFVVTASKKKKVETKSSDVVAPKQEEEFVVTSSRKKKVEAKDSAKSKDLDIVVKSEKQDSTRKNSVTEKQTSQSLPKIYGAPGKLIGKIINSKTGDGLGGATVTIKGGATTRTMRSDYNGNYSFSSIPSGVYEITCTYIGYATKTIDEVRVIKDDVTTQDITMKDSKGKDLDDVVIKSSGGGGKKNAETVSALLIVQKNAASVSDGISAEAIKRTPDRNTSDILKRVSGASIQDDKFAVIRGLSDRYNAVFLNSAPLPSTESDRKAFSFDIFPANMLDNLTIVKTATPDMPGEFAGGLIFINTKDIPSKDFQSVSFGVGYNTQTTFQKRRYYKGGRFDLIGLDDGTRAKSPNIPAAGMLPLDPVVGVQKNYGKFVSNDWRTLEATNPMNVNFQYVRGLNVQRKNNDYLGVLFAFTYSKNYNNTNGDRKGINYDRTLAAQDPIATADLIDENYSSQILAGLMGNVSLKINSNNKLSFKNILSINSDDRVIDRFGTTDITNNEPNTSSSVKWFTSNIILSSQLSGEHFIPKAKLKVNWMGSYSSVNRQIPNLRKTASRYDPLVGKVKQELSDFTLSPDNGGTMFYASTKENLKSFKLDLQRTFTFSNRFNIQLKAGAFVQQRNRAFSAELFGFRKYSTGSVLFDQSLLEQSEANIFDAKNIGKLKNGKGGFLLIEDFKKSNTYSASSALNAAYLMVDTRLFKFIRINGGVRVEKFNQKLDSYYPTNQPVNFDSTITDYLPSANLIFSLNAKQNLRLGYSRTLNRPEYRELAPFLFYDQAIRLSVSGDPLLKRATIDNYDIRYEIYPGKGQLLSVSAFYKKIINPIEQVLSNINESQTFYTNMPEAYIQGVEFETRFQLASIFKSNKQVLKDLTFFGNLSLMQSEVNLGADTILFGPNRPLQGQSPYLFNTGFIYQKENGFSATIQLNQVGQRIFLSGNTAKNHIWENGRPVVDLQIAKVFEKDGIELKLNVKDILARTLVKFYDLDDNFKYNADTSPNLLNLNRNSDKIFQTTNFGRTISASITYKF